MTGRGEKQYLTRKSKRAITNEDIYHMLMLHQHQRWSVEKIAKRFDLSTSDTRTIIGKRTGGSCCG